MDHKTETRHRPFRSFLLVPAAAAVVLVLGMFPGAASAGDVPQSATAVADCVENEGFISIEIIDGFRATYNVSIDGELVAEDITDTDGDSITFGPYEDGVYAVEVVEIEGQFTFNQDVTVDCVPDTTTPTTPPTTPTTPPTEPPVVVEPAAAEAVTASPTFTG
jgi:hypothetical protein